MIKISIMIQISIDSNFNHDSNLNIGPTFNNDSYFDHEKKKKLKGNSFLSFLTKRKLNGETHDIKGFQNPTCVYMVSPEDTNTTSLERSPILAAYILILDYKLTKFLLLF